MGAALLSHLLAQTTTQTTQNSALFSGIYLIVWLVLIAILIPSMWKIFTKAGKPGWASIVPIYNTFVQLEIVGRPAWWIILMFVPFVNFIISVIILIDLAKVFGKGSGFAIFMLFFPYIAYPMLAFGSATYVGPAGSTSATSTTPTGPVPVNGPAPMTSAPVPAPSDPTNPTPPQTPVQ